MYYGLDISYDYSLDRFDKTFPWLMIIFSSPELKAQVSYSDRLLSGVSVRLLKFSTSSPEPLGQL
jgi:hypothetical protein